MLADLYAGALADAATRLETESLSSIEKRAMERVPAIDALVALAPAENVKILAEIKRASPSRGELAKIESPADLAEIYEVNGASAISVLTEERKFGGSLQDLIAVREKVTIPLLRKDFIANEQQILEARASGADIVLLIVAGLTEDKISQLMLFTQELGMTPFIETHSADEVRLAVNLGSKLLGVNARDLQTFETNRNLFAELVDLIPSDTIKVAESAVRTSDDVKNYRSSGADVVLVGEALVTNDPGKMLRSFLGASNSISNNS